MAGIAASYINSTSFSVTGDQTTDFNTSRRCRSTCSGIYGYTTVVSSSYTSPTTTVIITDGVINEGLTVVYYGVQSGAQGSIPKHDHSSAEGEGGEITLLTLPDTPSEYDDTKYLRSTTSGTEWSSVIEGITDHSELDELDYASSGHTGFAPTSHPHTESDISDLDKYTQSEVNTISGSLQTNIDGKADTIHTHDDRYYTEAEVDTISGSLNTKIDGKADTSHLHDDRYYTETELDAGQLDNRYYTESEVDTISGTLQNDIDTHGHVSTEIIMSKINTPTYGTLQDWLNNTQSAGRMSGGDTTPHIDAVTGVTVSGAGYGEFKVSGDQTTGYIVSETINITGSTNNDGYYTVASGVVYSGDTTTIPVEEAVGSVADGNITNGTVDVADGTAFIKQTDSDIGETVSFDIHAETSIVLTDIVTNYVYVDYNAGNPDIKVTIDENSIEKSRQFPLSMVYKNNGRVWVCACGLYLPNRARLDHDRILALRGYERASGGEISEYGTRNIQSTVGEFYRGTTRIDTTAKASVDDKLTTVYYNGSGWVWTEDLTQIDNTYYNDIASGLVELTPNRFAVHWVCIDYQSNLYVVYGRGDYTLSQAELAGVPSFMPVVAYEFGIIAAKIIIKKDASDFEELLSAYTQVIPSTAPATHNDLSGLNEGDYKHLTATEKTKFDSIYANADVTGDNPPQAHIHDDRYYTETEVDDLFTAVSGTYNKIEDGDVFVETVDVGEGFEEEYISLNTSVGWVLKVNETQILQRGHISEGPIGFYSFHGGSAHTSNNVVLSHILNTTEYGRDAFKITSSFTDVTDATRTSLIKIGAANNGVWDDDFIQIEDWSWRMPRQPAFQVHPTTSQENLTVGELVTVIWGTERFDQGNDFASNTFTAPVTGKYQLQYLLEFNTFDVSATYFQIRIKTSNFNYGFVAHTDYNYDLGWHGSSFSVLADMDTNDTAYIDVQQVSGAVQTDIGTRSRFSGYLAC